MLLIDWLYCIDLFSCIAASVFNKLTLLYFTLLYFYFTLIRIIDLPSTSSSVNLKSLSPAKCPFSIIRPTCKNHETWAYTLGRASHAVLTAAQGEETRVGLLRWLRMPASFSLCQFARIISLQKPRIETSPNLRLIVAKFLILSALWTSGWILCANRLPV